MRTFVHTTTVARLSFPIISSVRIISMTLLLLYAVAWSYIMLFLAVACGKTDVSRTMIDWRFKNMIIVHIFEGTENEFVY